MASATVIPALRSDVALKKGGPWSDPPPNKFVTDLLDGAPVCGLGYVCMRIQETPGGLYDDFWYYNYGVYSLENWVGPGWLNNRQTGGASLRTLNASGRLIDCYDSYDGTGAISHPNWTPVYYIQLSPQRC